MRSAGPLAVVGLGLAACGTQDWSFFDVHAGASVDAGSVDAGSDVGSDDVGSNFDASSGCTSDNDCTSGYCSIPMQGVAERRCVACVEPSNCPYDRPACDLASNRCVQCGSDVDCHHRGEVCLPSRLWCVTSCVDDAGACVPPQVCLQSFGMCAACTSYTDCPTSAASHCDKAVGQCVQCTEDADCRDPYSPTCDPTTDQCVSCVRDWDCGRDGLCDPVMLTCTRGSPTPPMPTH